MPQNRVANDNQPPRAMTWGKAVPVLALCLVFDLLGLIFQFFWFFGPILLGVAAGAWWGSTLVGGVGEQRLVLLWEPRPASSAV